mmetsp:Transcript_10446/g.20738  ORF Transcript_10446/g.20738 Transcript_10446/m.20738 type:complete len:267 (+) Transcript_10446:34-834(+)
MDHEDEDAAGRASDLMRMFQKEIDHRRQEAYYSRHKKVQPRHLRRKYDVRFGKVVENPEMEEEEERRRPRRRASNPYPLPFNYKGPFKARIEQDRRASAVGLTYNTSTSSDKKLPSKQPSKQTSKQASTKQSSTKQPPTKQPSTKQPAKKQPSKKQPSKQPSSQPKAHPKSVPKPVLNSGKKPPKHPSSGTRKNRKVAKLKSNTNLSYSGSLCSCGPCRPSSKKHNRSRLERREEQKERAIADVPDIPPSMHKSADTTCQNNCTVM